jgi:signal transduction histidine kinase
MAAVLILLNVVMARLLLRSELEETANHLQIQALVAAQTLQDPVSGYALELEELEPEHDEDGEKHDEHEDHDEHEKREQRESKPAGLPSLLSRWAESFERDSRTVVLVADLQGRTLAGDGPPPTSEELVESRAKRPFHRVTESTVYACAPVSGQDGRVAGLVRLGLPRSAASSRSRALVASLAVTSAAALLLALLAAVWLSRRLVQPLRDLEKRARQAAQGEWGQPVELPGQDELASLSRAFSVMLLELQAMLERQRLFISHASHELRTPLTRMKLRTEALVDGALHDPAVAERFVQEIDGEVDRLGRLATTLLDLGRLDHGVEPQATPDPLAVLKAALERSQLPAEARGLQLLMHLPSALPSLRLGPDALDSVLANLLDNAIKCTPEGGTVTVTAQAEEQGVTLVVSDTGIGISGEHLPHIFDRFYRIDPSRSSGGTGLGLSLVKATVETAGGEIFVSSTEGRGTSFTVKLPWFRG